MRSWPILLAAVFLGVSGAQPAAAQVRHDDFGIAGTTVGAANVLLGSTIEQSPGAAEHPFVSVQDALLQPIGSAVFADVEGFLFDGDRMAGSGDLFGLVENPAGEDFLWGINPNGTRDPACVLGPLPGSIFDAVASDQFLFLVGETFDADSAKIVIRVDPGTCDPVPGEQGEAFDDEGVLLIDPTTEPDRFTAGQFVAFTGGGALVLAGEEGDDGEVDVLDESGNTGLFGHITIDLPDQVLLNSVQYMEDGDGVPDPGDRFAAGGQAGDMGAIFLRNGLGDPVTACGGNASGNILFDMEQGASGSSVNALMRNGSTLYGAGTVRMPSGQLGARINAYEFLNGCDLSSGPLPTWVDVLSGIQANDATAAAMKLMSAGIFVIGTFDNPANQSLDAFEAGPYNTGLTRQGFRAFDFTPAPNPGPGPGTGGGSGTGGITIFLELDTATPSQFLPRRGSLGPGGAVLNVRCPMPVTGPQPFDASCIDRIAIDLSRPGPSAARRVVIARGKATLRAGQSKRVRAKLTRAGKRVVRRLRVTRVKGRVRVKVLYRQAGRADQRRTLRRKVTFRVKRRHR